MKNKLSVLFLSMFVTGTSFAAETNDVSVAAKATAVITNSAAAGGEPSTPIQDIAVPAKKVTVEELANRNSAFFKNEPLSDVSAEQQKIEIQHLNAKYLDVKNYNEAELNELFNSFIAFGHNEAADLILNNGNVKVDVNRYNEKGLTPLMAASIAPIKGGNVEYAKKLIELGADVNLTSNGTEFSPISMATTVNNYKVVAYLILKGAAFMKADKLGYMPIDYALKNNSLESAKLLKEALTVKLKEVNGK
jgi:ankyrin repeat protein